MEYKAYSFDLDDNLLRLPTLVYLLDKDGKEISLPTYEYEKIRDTLSDEGYSLYEKSFDDFIDDDRFLLDIEDSVEAGSWKNLVKCICKHGSIFSIITARGHSPEALRQGLKGQILKRFNEENISDFKKRLAENFSVNVENKSNEDLLDIYLDFCRFYPITYPEIKKRLNGVKNLSDSELKYVAFQDFQKYVNDFVKEKYGSDCEVKIGFSDDSIIHLKTMINNILKSHGLFFYQTSDEGKSLF